MSRDFLVRTGSLAGDEIQIGSASFRIAAVLKSEPDRIAFGINLGPRILITRKGLERSGLIQFGSRASEAFLFRLPESGLSLDEARNIIQSSISRRIRIVDYRNPNPSVSRGLERATAFLSLIGLLSVLLGGLGVSTTIHAYLRQKLDSIAILKCIGGRSAQIIRIYMVQGLILGFLGSALGVGLGYLVQLLFPSSAQGIDRLAHPIGTGPWRSLAGILRGSVYDIAFYAPASALDPKGFSYPGIFARNAGDKVLGS